jgi:EpsI family protein
MDRTKKNAVCILVLALTVYGSSHSLKRALHSECICPYDVPDSIGGCEGEDIDTGIADLRSSIGAQDVAFRTYRCGDDTITLCLAYYKDVRSADMVHAPEVCYAAQGWTVVENDIVPRRLGRKNILVNRMVTGKRMKRELVYSWWQTGERTIPRNSFNRLYQVMLGIAGKHRSTVWVRISTAQEKNITHDEERITVFASDLMPLLANYFTGY